jgi:two-component system response regulator
MNSTTDILLVEDNPSDAELAIRALRKNNSTLDLLHLENGEELLSYMFATGKFEGRDIRMLPKLILLDLKMPRVNGLEVLEKIKADERTKAVPVVLLTSSKEDSDIRESYRLGANGYVVKPVHFESFVQVVSDIGLYWLRVNHSQQ